MKYNKTLILKDGRECIIRNGIEQDAEQVIRNFILTHRETNFLTTYPEETSFTIDQERDYLKRKADSEREAELVAVVNGEIVGTAGIGQIRAAEKTMHRASFGISIAKEWWGLGIGRSLTEGCIRCAKAAGYVQLELEVVASNERALALYQRTGFTEYGRNPKGFRSRQNDWQELVLMRLELNM